MLQHGAKRFHSAESDAADLAKFVAKVPVFPGAAAGSPSRTKRPRTAGPNLVGSYENYRRVPAP